MVGTLDHISKSARMMYIKILLTFLGRRIFGPQMSKNTYPQITIGIENPITIITKMMIKFTSIMVI